MLRDDCTRFDSCAAPLCPLDEGLPDLCWYPKEEEICLSIKQKNPFIKVQRKIIKKIQPENAMTYFTIEMLNKINTVSSGIKGIDSDKDEKQELKKWMGKSGKSKKRPILTIEEKKVLSDRLKKARSAGKS